MRRPGIQARILLVALLPALTIALALAYYFAHVRFVDLQAARNERALMIARQLAPAAEYGVFSGSRDVLQSLIAAVAKEADVVAVTIRGSDGTVLAHHGRVTPRPDHLPPGRVPWQTVEDRGKTLISSAAILRSPIALETYLTADLSPRPPPADEPPLGWVHVELSRTGLEAQWNRLLRDSMIISGLVLVAAVLLATSLSAQVIRPLTTLTGAVQKLARGQLDTRVTAGSAGVIGTLEHGVNTMAAALQAGRDDLERRIADATGELAAKKEEAERANNAKSRFLAAASHDLRQPLHALDLFVAALRDKPLPDEAQRIVGRIEKSVTAMADLLEALLDISRLDAGVIEPRPADFPVSDLLAVIESEYAPAAHTKGLRLRVARCAATIRSDPVLLERILRNLVSNAVHYTRHGKVLIGCRRRGARVRIEVWDTGPGIAEDQQRKVFAEFYRVPDAEPGPQKGVGLGLAIVDRLARLLGHRVELRSTPGRGSMFALEVPFGSGARLADASVILLPYRSPAMADTLALVIDDEPLALGAMQTLLETWGCRVLTAGSGAEAEARLAGAERPIDCVICDYRLGADETGIQVIDRLRAAAPTALPAILVSGDTTPDVARAAAQGGYPLLYKPVRPAKLRALLAHLLGHTDTMHRD